MRTSTRSGSGAGRRGFQSAKATFRSALNLMSEYEDFVFTSSSAAIYEWVELNDPPMFREIQARVAEGRWQIAGGWWIQSLHGLALGLADRHRSELSQGDRLHRWAQAVVADLDLASSCARRRSAR